MFDPSLFRVAGRHVGRHVGRRLFARLPVTTRNTAARLHSSTVPEIRDDQRRFNMPIFYGAMGNETKLNDELPCAVREKLDSIQKDAQKAVEGDKSEDFVKSAFRAVKWLGNLPAPTSLTTDPRWFPPHHLFVQGHHAPAEEILTTAFEHIFQKVTVVDPDRQNPNHTGMAIHGVRGVGKSTILRLVTLVAPILLPDRVVSVYVDYKSNAGDMPLISALLRDAAGLDPHSGDRRDSVGNVISEIEKLGRCAVVCADEVLKTYTTEIWTELYGVATSLTTVGIIADSSAKLPALVEQAGHEKKIWQWFPKYPGYDLPPSLNDEKLQNEYLPPFSDPEQYRGYLKHIRDCKFLGFNDAKQRKEYISNLHCRTGGKIRNFGRKKTKTKSIEPLTFHYYVLMKILERQVQRKWDPFNVASASYMDIASWTKEWKALDHTTGEAEDVETMLDGNVLALVPDGQGGQRITFGVPKFAAEMMKSIPRVFLSHATSDGKISEKLRKRLEARGVCVIAMEQTEAQVAMMEETVPGWMDNHTTRSHQHKMFLLSDAFVEQLEKGDEASTERELSNAIKSSQGSSKYPEPIYVCEGSFKEKWRGKHPLLKDVCDKLVVRIGQYEEKALFRVLGLHDDLPQPLRLTLPTA